MCINLLNYYLPFAKLMTSFESSTTFLCMVESFVVFETPLPKWVMIFLLFWKRFSEVCEKDFYIFLLKSNVLLSCRLYENLVPCHLENWLNSCFLYFSKVERNTENTRFSITMTVARRY